MKKLAVHLHFYYRDQLEKSLLYLKNLSQVDYDLYVTLSKKDIEIERKFRQIKPDADIWITSNKGYDVGPFIDFLHRVDLDGYQYILKIHTKNYHSKNYTWLNGNRMNGELWNQILWDALLKSENRVRQNISILDKSRNIGMLSSAYCIVSSKENYQKLLPDINRVLQGIGFKKRQTIKFVAGTMFYVRSKLLKPLLKYQMNDFEKTDGSIKEGTLAHVFERLLGSIIEQQGYQIQGIRHDGYTIRFLWIACKRFVYQKKVTNSNRMIIKIFKLPVYTEKR